MPTITAYQTLRDGGHNRLQPNGTLSVSNTFNPSNDIRLNGNDNRPLLCFRVDPSSTARNLRLVVRINGQSVGPNPITLSGTTSRTFFEIVSHGVIEKGNNLISFALDNSSQNDGRGSLVISDVVIWYKRFVN